MEFPDTKLFALYYHELWWLSNSVVRNCEEIFSKTIIPVDGYMIQVDPEIHSKISSLLSDAANIKKLVYTPDVKLKGENGERFKLRKARASALLATIEALEVKELLNHKVRNTLEHFDEYLDEANYKISRSARLNTMAAYNMVISHWEVVEPRMYPLRLYVTSERKFYNMKWEVDIGLIYKEAQLIVAELNKSPSFANQEPGGLMVPV
jgi:hypothetical protein